MSMKPEFEEYIRSVGAPTALQSRVAEIYEFYESICPEAITDIVVTDYIDNGQTRHYESLWFFSRQYSMEAHQFIEKDEFDIVPIEQAIAMIQFDKQDYDFKRATETSRINVTFRIGRGMGIVGNLKGARENCDHIRDVVLKHLIPNLVK